MDIDRDREAALGARQRHDLVAIEARPSESAKTGIVERADGAVDLAVAYQEIDVTHRTQRRFGIGELGDRCAFE